ncbi:putative drug exporter of the RND superfamily [Agromyces sp. CF514]|uniref:MMPL family transporter n=1 Tax=Agromyces sp. CF514 TaxID=1881031 RepID=UPI0008E64191|nr:MMPL family transporter [Agromyces sp. CF514]SFR82517.1 putative drug exporter of the RND superfamily [Agromyces sp. CF514]
MSTLLYSLGRWSYRHPWRVLVSWLLLLVIAGGAFAMFGKGTSNSFSIPGTEAQAGLEQLNRSFPQASGTSAQFIVVAADGDSIENAPYTTEIEQTIGDIEGLDGVLAVTDPYDEMVTGLVSDDETAALVRLQFDGEATDVPESTKEQLHEITDELGAALPESSQVALGGDLFAVSVPGITLTEGVGVLIALFVLIVVFRSFAVGALPLASAVIGVGLSLSLIMLSTAFASISSTTPLLALMLGLAVGIDYALFIMARHQDQVRAGEDPEESAARATGTAGSAVVFAGITVLIALIGLGFANIPFLTVMGIAAAVAVAIAVLVAITLTPAFLGFAKGRVVGWRRREPRGRRRARQQRADAARGRPSVDGEPAASDDQTEVVARRGFATRWVGLVTRHPVVTTVAIVLGLGIVAIPAGSLALALPNAGMLPKDDPARVSYDLVAEHFGPGFNGPLVLTGTIVTSTDPLGLMEDLGDEIATLPGVETVALATPNETADTGIVQVIPTTAPDDPATADLVRELRGLHDHFLDEYGIDLKVTGFTAVAIDISDRLGAALVPFGVFVVGLSLILLAIVFRSIWVPITAAAGYLLSVVAAFGVVAAVFEWGWGADLLHVTKVGPIISFMPIVAMGVLFGLAMDYQVFLVSRMREDYVHARRALDGHSSRQPRDIALGAVRSGFTASARVVTAAAIIMFAVFAAFVPEGDSSLKPIALGLAVGIAIDAFIVRMTLVPAVMALLGDKAWWLPKWLDRLLPHFDIEGEAVERERALADWPEPDTTAAVVASDLSLVERDVTVFERVSLRVEPGGALVVRGPDEIAARALLLALAGRIDTTGGRLRVAGHLLPGRSAWVRGHVGVALLAEADDPVVELRKALRGRTGIVVVDGVDHITDPATRDRLAALLWDASLEASVTVVISALDAEGARGLLAAAGHPDAPTIELAAPVAAVPALSTTEVNA